MQARRTRYLSKKTTFFVRKGLFSGFCYFLQSIGDRNTSNMDWHDQTGTPAKNDDDSDQDTPLQVHFCFNYITYAFLQWRC